MNVRLTILLAVVAALIGSTWAIIEFTNLVVREKPAPDEPWLYHIDESTITRIEVAHGGQSAQYARDSGGIQWMIVGDTDYPVFQRRWGGTTLLLSGPRVNRGLSKTIGNPASYGLDPPETIVRVTDWADNTIEFHLGIPTPDGNNQYARLVGDNALYTLPSVWADVVNRLAIDPPWGKLFDLEINQIPVVEVNAGEQTAVYFADGAQWLVSPAPPPVDPATAAPVSEEWLEWLELLAAPRIDQVVEQQVPDRETEKLEMYGLASPAVRVVIARRGEAPVEIHLADGPPGSGSYYARTLNNNDDRVYTILKSRLEGIEALATDPLVIPGWEPLEETPAEQEESAAGN